MVRHCAKFTRLVDALAALAALSCASQSPIDGEADAVGQDEDPASRDGGDADDPQADDDGPEPQLASRDGGDADDPRADDDAPEPPLASRDGDDADDPGADDDGPEPQLASRDGGDADDPRADDDAPEPHSCEIPEFTDASDPVSFERLRARVVDPEGAPVAGTTAQACGMNLCLFGDTDADGNIMHQDMQALRRPAFKYGDGVRHAQLALLLGDGPEHELGDQVTVAFPELASADPFEAGMTLSSGGVELLLGEAVKIDVDFLTFSEAEQVFVAAEFPQGAFPDAALGQDFEALFALGPVKTKFCPAAKLRLPNTHDLEPGRPLELSLHGTDVLGQYAPYADWAEVSDAVVSDDGQTIETADGQGLPMLGVVGVK